MNELFTFFMMLGAVSSASELPFWATSNQFGLMPEGNGVFAVAGANTEFDEENTFQWKWGVSLAANAGKKYFGEDDAVQESETSVSKKLMVDELYASLKIKNIPLTLDLGMKHQPMEFISGTKFSDTHSALGSLSTTGGHMLWSGNARTLPGYALNLEPVAIPWTNRKALLYGTFGDYKTLDTRYCQGELIHSTKAFLRIDFTNKLSFHIGLDHYAAWGGDKDYVNVNFKNYLRVVTGRNAGDDGTLIDRLNVIGDQGGAELFKLEYNDDRFYAVAQHDIPYSDGSGMKFQNFPDGMNTLYFGWKDKNRWVSDILFEYGYTRYQSGPIHIETYDEDGHFTTPDGSCTTGIDDYFNNSEYKDGWTYSGRMIGCPLFFTNTPEREGYTPGIRNNRFTSHHISIAGKLFKIAPYKLMLTQSMNYGTYASPYIGESAYQKPWGSVKETGLSQFSAAFVGEIPVPVISISGLSVTYGLYWDKGEVLEDNFGCTLGLNLTI